jgi:hypothetical protein
MAFVPEGRSKSLRPGGTRDSSPAIYRRVGVHRDLRPGGTLEVQGEPLIGCFPGLKPEVETLGLAESYSPCGAKNIFGWA